MSRNSSTFTNLFVNCKRAYICYVSLLYFENMFSRFIFAVYSFHLILWKNKCGYENLGEIQHINSSRNSLLFVEIRRKYKQSYVCKISSNKISLWKWWKWLLSSHNFVIISKFLLILRFDGEFHWNIFGLYSELFAGFSRLDYKLFHKFIDRKNFAWFLVKFTLQMGKYLPFIDIWKVHPVIHVFFGK